MTQVDFHTGVADKLAYACRLVRKAWRSGHRVVVTGDAGQLARLDAQLWTFDPGDFVPHVRQRAGQPVPAHLARTPIWLCDAPAGLPPEAGGGASVLVNLGPAAVDGLADWPRLVELVGEAPDDVAAGRQRWRQHLAAGRQPVNRSQRGAV